MSIISIKYDYNDDPSKIVYKAVELTNVSTLEKEKYLFDTGDFVKDWNALNKFIYAESELYKKEPISHSSSVDHFIMDTEDYASKYLDLTGDEAVFTNEYDERFVECFILKGTDPTWEEYQEYCKNIGEDNGK